MLTGIDRKNVISSLNRSKLPDYWGDYFAYEKDTELNTLTQTALQKVIEETSIMPKPYIDSKIAISDILTDLGPKSTFHRQFNKRHPDLHKEQVLGMQLYKLIVEDTKNTWVFFETHHLGHVFPNATYFIP
ncbi:MAG: hypothetical protein LBL74_08305 [Bacteroidales bacterium]|jgi:hypothetical protein|nr:hypothetical protein [Bacteroidales bacterium]